MTDFSRRLAKLEASRMVPETEALPQPALFLSPMAIFLLALLLSGLVKG